MCDRQLLFINIALKRFADKFVENMSRTISSMRIDVPFLYFDGSLDEGVKDKAVSLQAEAPKNFLY